MKSDFMRYRQTAGLTQAEASEVFGYSGVFVARKYDKGLREPPDAAWLGFLNVCKNNIQKTLHDIEEDIRETERRLFGEC